MARPPASHTVDAQLRLAVYHVERTPYHRLRAEIEHPHWAISHVADGDVRTVTRSGRFQAPRGSVMVHPPGLPYAEYSEGSGIHEWVIFEAGVSPGHDFLRLHPLPPVVALRAPAEFSSRFDDLLAAWRRPPDDPGRQLRVFSLTTQLLAQLVDDWRAAGAPPRPVALQTAQDRFTGLVHHLSAGLHRRITRAELARAAHLQPNSLDRAFRAAYGVPPLQMLRQMRLQRARHLLENSDFTVERIAQDCGFGEASRFTRAFRQEHGEPPGRYRQGVNRARTRYAPP